MRGCIVGGSGIRSPQRAGVEGLLPLLHLRLGISLRSDLGLPWHLRPHARRKEPPHRPGPLPLRRWPTASCWRSPSTRALRRHVAAGATTSATPSARSPSCRRSPRAWPSSSASSTAAPPTSTSTPPGAIMIPGFLAEHAGSPRRSSSSASATAWSCGIARAGTTIDRRCSAASRRSPRELAILLDMPCRPRPGARRRALGLLDPAPGQTRRSTAPSAAAVTRGWSPSASGPAAR